MEKITIKIEDDLLKKMNERMEQKGCKTLSQCARELIELGLKIEETAALQEGIDTENDISPLLLDMLKLNLTWVLETRFLLKYWMLNETSAQSMPMSDVLEKAKKKAADDVLDIVKNAQKNTVKSDVS